jgi:tRNA/tmRNA/rRNA uracil-C5-methylase (TrmA/RlmC/RlmD family)
MGNQQLLKKMDMVRLQINGLTHTGEGVGRHNGMAVFPWTRHVETVVLLSHI